MIIQQSSALMGQPKEESNALFERALRLLKEAVGLANIKDMSEYRHTPAYSVRYWAVLEEDRDNKMEWPKVRWDVFKWELDRDIILCIQIHRTEGVVWVETSLHRTAVDLLRGAQEILQAPDAVKLVDFSNSEQREEAIDYNVRSTLLNYIHHLPLMLAQATARAYEDSIQHQIKTSIEPALREHWQNTGLPKDFDFMSYWKRYSYGEQLEEFRKVFIGAKKTPIPEHELSTLPKQYEELRLLYRKAKKYHDETKELFLAARNRNNINAWRSRWEEDCTTMFPTLYYVPLMMICDGGYQGRELAYQHLAYKYGRGPEYIRTLISNSASLARDRKKSNKTPSTRRPKKS